MGSMDTDFLKKTWFVIPAFNEGLVIGDVVRNILLQNTNVCVVNDGSSDETARLSLDAGAHVLSHIVNRGQGAALQTGIEYSLLQGAEYIITFDADGQHDPDNVPEMIRLLYENNLDIVLGSRVLGNTENMSVVRKIMLRIAVIFTNMSTSLNLTDTHNGLRALSRNAALKVNLRQDRMAHASEILSMIADEKMKYKEYPVTIRYSEYSKAKGQRLGSILRIVEDLILKRMSK